MMSSTVYLYDIENNIHTGEYGWRNDEQIVFKYMYKK